MEAQIPGGPYINETVSTQQQIPGDQFVNETGAGAPAAVGQPYQKRLGGIPGMGIVQPGFTHTW